MHGFGGEIIFAEATGGLPDFAYHADLFVGATNVTDVIDVGRLKPGAIIVDDSFPLCFDLRWGRFGIVHAGPDARESVCRPLRRRRKIEFEVRIARTWPDKGLETGVPPQFVGACTWRERRECQGIKIPGQRVFQHHAALITIDAHLKARDRAL